MTTIPKIPKSALDVLRRAGICTLEDFTGWSRNVCELRGFGPRAFEIVVAAMSDAGLAFDPASKKDPSAVNRAMAEERMQGVKSESQRQLDLPRIGKPATSALVQIDIHQLEQLQSLSRDEVLELHGMGPKAIGILEEALAMRGMSFRSD